MTKINEDLKRNTEKTFSDPFYSKENMDRLLKSVSDLNAGNGKSHEVDYNE